jgi:5'(3')-deoxyribonucleotidase
MKKLHILVDIDSTIADTLLYWLKTIKDDTGVEASVAEITEWDISKCGALKTLNREKVFSYLSRPGFTLNIPAIKDAHFYLKCLQDAGHKITFATAREGMHAKEETVIWLYQNFKGLEDCDLCFLKDKTKIQADVFIDDNLNNLNSYTLAHPRALVMGLDMPYNKNMPLNKINPTGLYSDWTDIFDAIRHHTVTHLPFLDKIKKLGELEDDWCNGDGLKANSMHLEVISALLTRFWPCALDYPSVCLTGEGNVWLEWSYDKHKDGNYYGRASLEFEIKDKKVSLCISDMSKNNPELDFYKEYHLVNLKESLNILEARTNLW